MTSHSERAGKIIANIRALEASRHELENLCNKQITTTARNSVRAAADNVGTAIANERGRLANLLAAEALGESPRV
jgi:hypothetical protein